MVRYYRALARIVRPRRRSSNSADISNVARATEGHRRRPCGIRVLRATDVRALIVVAAVLLPRWAGRALHGAAPTT
eukprot:8799371-Pyramimonas_sp.AAC.1